MPKYLLEYPACNWNNHDGMSKANKRRELLEYYETHKFYPKGIAKMKKNKFTANELIDIYIKANPDILFDMCKAGFGDKDGFLTSETDWFNGLVEAPKRRSIASEVKFAMFNLITSYLDAPKTAIGLSAVALLGSTTHTVLIGQCVSVEYDLPKEVLIEGIGEVCGINCTLYYKFFKAISDLRISHERFLFYTSKEERCGLYTEDIAQTLEETNRYRAEIKTLSKQINKIAREK